MFAHLDIFEKSKSVYVGAETQKVRNVVSPYLETKVGWNENGGSEEEN